MLAIFFVNVSKEVFWSKEFLNFIHAQVQKWHFGNFSIMTKAWKAKSGGVPFLHS